MKHPMQKITIDKSGTARFVENKIVRTLLDTGPLDMNRLAMLEFSDEDREQFAQLIGYSVSGFGELSYVSDRAYNKAEAIVRDLVKEKRNARAAR